MVKIVDIVIKMHNGIVRPTRNADISLIFFKKKSYSLGILEEEGHVFIFGNNTLKIMKGSLIVMKGLKRNGLYYLEGNTILVPDPSLFTVIENRYELWHSRM